MSTVGLNRRGFLASLIGAALTDPERLLWEKGKNIFSIPNMVRLATAEETIKFAGIRMVVSENIRPRDILFTSLSSHCWITNLQKPEHF